LLLAVLTPGCAKNQPEPTTAEKPSSDVRTDDLDDATKNAKDSQRGHVEISDRIREACGISNADSYFAFNSAAVSSQANDVLKKLADCFTTGPLAGTSIRLVGHTDPRGDEEYNMLLGGRRADNVKKVLVRFGSGTDQLKATSRGEMDATGVDEESWARDRKVRIEVAN
jgi:peptidoglycan-associated lipoprotein